MSQVRESIQQQYMKKHDKNMHQVGRSAGKPKTYTTFLDWRNHLSGTHPTCIRDGDPLLCAKYAAGFKLEDWGWFHDLDGSDTDSAYQHVVGIRGRYGRYGRYQGQVEGQSPGPPSTFRLHHIKGSTPDKDTTPTESERVWRVRFRGVKGSTGKGRGARGLHGYSVSRD